MSATHQLRQWLADHPKHHPEADAKTRELEKLERAEGLQTRIKREGQKRIDEPQYSTAHAFPLAHSVAAAYGREIPQAVQVFEGYAPVNFRWMKPGPDGKLIPS